MITQYGVLPWRLDPGAGLQLLLITSKERRRWVIPKGNPIPFFLNHESAAREAYEEAGVEGRIAAAPVGNLPLRQAPALGRLRAGDRHRLSPARHPRGRRLAGARRARTPLVRAGRGGGGGRGAGSQGVDPRLPQRCGPSLSARFPGCYGRESFLLGVQDAEIRPRHHAEGGPLLRHVRAPCADPRRRRRRDGADARRARRRSPESCKRIAAHETCRRRRHPRRAGRGPPLVHHPVRPQRDHRAHLGDGRCDRRDVADRQGDHALRGEELRAADGGDGEARRRGRRGSCSRRCR